MHLYTIARGDDTQSTVVIMTMKLLEHGDFAWKSQIG